MDGLFVKIDLIQRSAASQPVLIESDMQKEVEQKMERWRTWRMKLLLVLVGILLVMLASSLRKAPVGQH